MMTTNDGTKRRWARSPIERYLATAVKEVAEADLSLGGKLSAKGGRKMGEEGEGQEERKEMEVGEEAVEEAEAEELVGRVENRGGRRRVRGRPRCSTVMALGPITRKGVVREEEVVVSGVCGVERLANEAGDDGL